MTKQIVYVAVYEHRHGVDARVFAAPEVAEIWRQEIAENWWDEEIDDAPPSDPREKADHYFNEMAGRPGEYESFTVTVCEVEE